MPSLSRINVAWQNWPGAPGVTTFFRIGQASQTDVDGIRAFFNAFANLLPTALTINVPGQGDVIDDATGNIISAWAVGTTPTTVTGTGGGAYAGNAGACVHWLTTTIVNNRRVRGRSFLVPLIASAYDTSGSLATATITTLTTAANGLLAAMNPNQAVWHRPTKFAQGSSAAVNGMRVPDLAVSLRSRRV